MRSGPKPRQNEVFQGVVNFEAMTIERRGFLGLAGFAGAGAALGSVKPAWARSASVGTVAPLPTVSGYFNMQRQTLSGLIAGRDQTRGKLGFATAANHRGRRRESRRGSRLHRGPSGAISLRPQGALRSHYHSRYDDPADAQKTWRTRHSFAMVVPAGGTGPLFA